MPVSKKQKKRSPFKFFFAVMAVIIALAVITELSSRRVKQLSSPLNAEVLNLSTCGNYLAAIFNDSQMYLWNWDDLALDPQKFMVPSMPAVVLSADRIATCGTAGGNSLVVSRLGDRQKIREIPLGFNNNLIHVTANRDRSTLAVLLAPTTNNESSHTNYQLLTINPDTEQSNLIITLDKETTGSQLNHCTISDDSKQVVLLGGRYNEGLIIMVDIMEKKTRWEKTIPELKQFDKAAFAPDGKWFFAGGDDLVLYKIQTNSGEDLRRITAGEKIDRAVSTATFFDLSVSGNGKMVAAVTTNRKGGVWECKRGHKIVESIGGSKAASNVAFSPDSRLLAISAMQTGGEITIIKLPLQ